jgi:hypothetical protein
MEKLLLFMLPMRPIFIEDFPTPAIDQGNSSTLSCLSFETPTYHLTPPLRRFLA